MSLKRSETPHRLGKSRGASGEARKGESSRIRKIETFVVVCLSSIRARLKMPHRRETDMTLISKQPHQLHSARRLISLPPTTTSLSPPPRLRPLRSSLLLLSVSLSPHRHVPNTELICPSETVSILLSRSIHCE